MKNIVEHIDDFLKKKDIAWVDKQVFEHIPFSGTCRLAKEEDFSQKQMQELKFKSKEGKEFFKSCLITENLFLVFDGSAWKLKLKYDFSAEWKNYLQSIANKEEEQLKQD